MSWGLTTGALFHMMHYKERVREPVLQIIQSKNIYPRGSPTGSSDRYRVLISDGQYTTSCAMTRYQVANLSVVKIKRYCLQELNSSPTRRHINMLLILEMEVVATGAMVGNKIGDPVTLSLSGTPLTDGVSSTSHLDSSTEEEPQITHSKLAAIFRGESVARPVVQLLRSVKLFPDKENYRCLLSDGHYHTSNVMTLECPSVNNFSLIRLNRYNLTELEHDNVRRKVLLLVDLEVVEDGLEIGLEMGNSLELDVTINNNERSLGEIFSTSLDGAEAEGVVLI